MKEFRAVILAVCRSVMRAASVMPNSVRKTKLPLVVTAVVVAEFRAISTEVGLRRARKPNISPLFWTAGKFKPDIKEAFVPAPWLGLAAGVAPPAAALPLKPPYNQPLVEAEL